MNSATKLSGFALGLAAVFGATDGVGHLAGPVTPPPRPGTTPPRPATATVAT